jgi:hypothetical protein
VRRRHCRGPGEGLTPRRVSSLEDWSISTTQRLPGPGNRWLEILWHCLSRGVLYDEAVHVANRNRALGRAD